MEQLDKAIGINDGNIFPQFVYKVNQKVFDFITLQQNSVLTRNNREFL